MQVTATKSNVLSLITNAAAVVDKKATTPVLLHVLMEADGSEMKISATNLELSYTGRTEAHIKEKGRCLIPSAPFLKLIKTIKDDSVDITATSEHVVITADRARARFTFPVRDPDDFPVFTVPEACEDMIPVDADSFVSCISNVLHAASKDNYQGVRGVLIKKVEEYLHSVATDASRLAIRKTHAPELPLERPLVISTEAALMIKRLFKESSVIMLKQLKESLVLQNEAGDLIEIRELQKPFPDYQEILTRCEAEKIAFEVQTADFIKTLKRISVACENSFPYVHLTLSGSTLTAEARSDTTEAKEKIHVDTDTETETISAAYNVNFLLDALKSTTGEKITIGFRHEPPVLSIYENNDVIELIAPASVE
jgi:DNA polymerase-3 subunit beta